MMSRSSGVLVGVAVMSLLAGCGAAVTEAVVGVPATAAAAVVQSGSGLDAVPHLQALLNQLTHEVAAGGDPESPQLLAQLEALSNERALINAEKGDVMKQFAAAQISSRQALVSTLIMGLQARPRLDAAQRSAAISGLKTVSAQLTALGSVIAADPLMDRLRTEIGSITSAAQIYSVVQPLNQPGAH